MFRADRTPSAYPGHTAGSTAYHFADLDVLFTGDALVIHDGLTGRTGPALVCRGFTHDSRAALASPERLAQVPASLLLPGHGESFPSGPQAAVEHARRLGVQ